MCTSSCLTFGRSCLQDIDLRRFRVLEVGARDVNGSLRWEIEPRCLEYIGVDIQPGPGVDRICEAAALVGEFGAEQFDLVICTEVLEHVMDWRSAVKGLKEVLRPEGLLLFTVPSKGFGYHEYPADFWRYELSDMPVIFSGFDMLQLNENTDYPGVLMFARKSAQCDGADLSAVKLYSILYHRRIYEVPAGWERMFFFRLKKWTRGNKALIRKVVPKFVRQRLYNRMFK